MRRPAKIVAWIVVFAAAAGAGAYVAAHTDPFPPGVNDPGERPTPTPTATVTPGQPELRRWQLVARAETEHILHVGGSCHSDWDVQAFVHERSDGSLAGSGLATLRGEGGCDFPTAVVQTQVLDVVLSGSVLSDAGPTRLRLRFGAPRNRDPVGSKDLGGLDALLPGFTFTATTGEASAVSKDRPDGNEGSFTIAWRARISCVGGC